MAENLELFNENILEAFYNLKDDENVGVFMISYIDSLGFKEGWFRTEGSKLLATRDENLLIDMLIFGKSKVF